jgi:DNA-directed RNA polymerase specialized sigma24 family protein
MRIDIHTRSVLLAWARWGRLQNLGYPVGSSFFGERALKTPLFESTYAPPDVLEMDRAIGQLEPDERTILIHKYLWHMSLSQLGERWACTKWSARRRLENAEQAAHVAYCALGTRYAMKAPQVMLSLQVTTLPGATIYVTQ